MANYRVGEPREDLISFEKEETFLLKNEETFTRWLKVEGA